MGAPVDITETCTECKNFFLKDKVDPFTCIHSGTFSISGGTLTPSDFLKQGQYFRIVGSDLNERVFLNTSEGLAELKDEVFSGSVWAMSVPPQFVALTADIEAWRAANEKPESVAYSSMASESLGNYSYSKDTSSGGKSGIAGAAKTWQTVFYDRLTPYRRISVL